MLGNRMAKEKFLSVLSIGNGAKLLAHSPFRNHTTSHLGGHANIRRGPRCNFIGSKNHFFGNTTSHSHSQISIKPFYGHRYTTPFGKTHHHSQGPPAGNNGDASSRRGSYIY